jgi:putative holliday junction resolvase
MTALGLDIGKKRIGVAGSDGLGWFASGMATIERRSLEQVIDHLRRICAERQVTKLIVGMPYLMDGTIGPQAKSVEKLARTLARALDLEMILVDERLTSFQAEQDLIEQGVSPSRNKGLIDRRAAEIILQQWLDQQRETGDLPASSPLQNPQIQSP